MKKTPAQRQHMMLHEPVQRIIPKLAIPTIISMLITSIYNMADAYFVSKLGKAQSGAVGVVFSVMGIIQAIAFTIGMGSGAQVSQELGNGRRKEAQTLCSVGFFTALITGFVIMLLGNLFLDPIVSMLGATDTIAPHARDYAAYIFYAAPFMMCSFVMNNHLRFQGLATYGMLGITAGGLLNLVLDPIFIYEAGHCLFTLGSGETAISVCMPFGLNLGTAGAAIATAISQAASFLILLLQCNLRRDALSISLRHFLPTRRMYGKILYIGFPSLGRQGIASVSNILLTHTIRTFVPPELQDAAIAALTTVVSKFVMFINSSVIGFGQGFQPVCGFNFGAKQYKRVRQAFWFSVKVTTIILLVLGTVSFIFAEPIVTFLGPTDEPAVAAQSDPSAADAEPAVNAASVIDIAAVALRIHLVTLPLWGFIVMSNMYTQSIGCGARATLLSASRQGLFLIPALLILPRVLPLTGADAPFAVAAAQPVADALSFVMAILIILNIMKQFKAMPDKEPAT